MSIERASNPAKNTIVPFGKYRGQPVELMLADRSYIEWLLAQPWLFDQHLPIYNIIVAAGAEPQDTPEHNGLQARFLDHAEACRMLTAVDIAVAGPLKVRFELGSWDLFLEAETANYGDYTSKVRNVAVELKPTVGEDYPSILRTVTRRREHAQTAARNAYVRSRGLITDEERLLASVHRILVLAESVTFVSVTLDQVKRIFASQGIDFLTIVELPPPAPCSCSSCAAVAP